MPTAELDGLELHYEEHGSGRPLLLVAGIPAIDVDQAPPERFVEKKSRDVQDGEGYRAQIAAVLAHDTRDRLPRIDRPTLILTGDDDQVIPAPSSDVLHERIPDSLLYVIAGAGHLFFLERPDETVRALQSFVPA